jgi:hypothetical protein
VVLGRWHRLRSDFNVRRTWGWWHPNCISIGIPRYYLKLVDGHLVANYGAHDLEDDAAAQIAAIELARSVRELGPNSSATAIRSSWQMNWEAMYVCNHLARDKLIEEPCR